MQAAIHQYTGCLLGLGTDPAGSLGLEPFLLQVDDIGPKPFLQCFQRVWRVWLEPLFLLLCYNSANIPAFELAVFKPYLIKMFKVFFEVTLFRSFGGLIGQASICTLQPIFQC